MRLNFRPNLSELRASVRGKVNDEAEKQRLRFITPGSAQAMVYDQKAVEAKLYQGNPSVSEFEIPHITAEALALGISLDEISQIILQTKARWLVISAAIESKRQQLLNQIETSNSVVLISGVENFDWTGYIDQILMENVS